MTVRKSLDQKKCCLMKQVCNLVGDSWSVLILFYLMNNPMRFSQLQEQITCTSTSTLTNRLKHLVEFKLISRKEYKETPPKVEYQLTEKGYKLAQIFQQAIAVISDQTEN
jgi:DNA-binding HxlR family transcriptional regulator